MASLTAEHRPAAAIGRLGSGVCAAVVMAGAVALVAGQAAVRRVEAGLSADVLGLVRFPRSSAVGSTVLFRSDGHEVGFSLTPWCTVAMLVLPFLLIGGALLLTRRVPPGRVLVAIGIATALLVAVNQLRFVVVATWLRRWGAGTGSTHSLVLVGTVVTTVGVTLALAAFAWLLAGQEAAEG